MARSCLPLGTITSREVNNDTSACDRSHRGVPPFAGDVHGGGARRVRTAGGGAGGGRGGGGKAERACGRDGAIAKCLRSAGIFGEARRRISERAGGGALPLHRESRFAARVRVVLASGPLPNVGASRRRGARRWTSLAADIRA